MGDFCKSQYKLKKVRCLAQQNKIFAVNRSVDDAELIEFNYFELIYNLAGQSLLQTGVDVSEWGNFV